MKLTQFIIPIGLLCLSHALYQSSKEIRHRFVHSPLHHKPVTVDSAISTSPPSSSSFIGRINRQLREMASYLWRKYADYVYTKWERTILWDMIDPYRRPKSFTPLVTIYIVAFYSGVVGAAITEQLYKEKYWEDHPGEAVPLMKPKFYYGPWRVMRGEVPAHTK